MPPIKAIVFDLDGTLMDSKIDYPRMGQLIAEVLQSYGMTEPLEDRRKVYRVIRGGERTLREYGHPEENIPITLLEMEKVMNLIELEALVNIQLKPYAVEAVKMLNESGYKLGIATRSHREYTIQGLTKFGLFDYFHHIVARDDVELPKPHPHHLLHTIELLEETPETSLFIGDTTTDLDTAKAANVKFIGYWRDDDWAKRLVEAGCKTLIKDLREIKKIVED
ncbi:HAD-IA family hydrolase [Candidatus Bathyarchaeota archaeon]|jgi:phosphoglycolate phosphatase|nr:HAD-IA family hydrolase [Candidatus Bathyarchaeota archaeon]